MKGRARTLIRSWLRSVHFWEPLVAVVAGVAAWVFVSSRIPAGREPWDESLYWLVMACAAGLLGLMHRPITAERRVVRAGVLAVFLVAPQPVAQIVMGQSDGAPLLVLFGSVLLPMYMVPLGVVALATSFLRRPLAVEGPSAAAAG